MAEKIAAENAPLTEEDCWFIGGNNGETAGYPGKKLSTGPPTSTGSIEILHFLRTPANYPCPAGQEIAHRCRRGRFKEELGVFVACVNPAHTTSCSHDVNLSHNQCGNGCRKLCPHAPKCVWTRESDGVRLTCRDSWPLPTECLCGRGCFDV
jgi:hypothetical protein